MFSTIWFWQVKSKRQFFFSGFWNTMLNSWRIHTPFLFYSWQSSQRIFGSLCAFSRLFVVRSGKQLFKYQTQPRYIFLLGFRVLRKADHWSLARLKMSGLVFWQTAHYCFTTNSKGESTEVHSSCSSLSLPWQRTFFILNNFSLLLVMDIQ